MRRKLAGVLLALVMAAPAAAQFTAEEFLARRARLATDMAGGALVVFGAAAPEADYLPFMQAEDFRYLTGITEPDAALVLTKREGVVSMVVFVQPRDPAREVWEGERLGVAGAEALTGLDARASAELMPYLDSLLTLGLPLQVVGSVEIGRRGGRASRDQSRIDQLRGTHAGATFTDASALIERLRARKSDAELAALRTAIEITVLAQQEAMRLIEPGMNEFEVEALIEYTFRRYGAERPGFASIVGSGPNSTSLHYNANDRVMRDGDVVVMDVGALWGGYSADVTRTVPVGGTFSPEQRALYGIVLDAQAAAERAAVIGVSWTELTQAAARVLSDGLTRLGLIEASDAVYDAEGGGVRPQMQLFYMHGLGHGIGLEVHDPNPWSRGLAVGGAFTIEPGLYVRADVLEHLPDTPRNRSLIERIAPAVRRFANIGVRIEDDYFLTQNGLERVSRAPREIDEIEALMAQPWTGPSPRNPSLVGRYGGGSGR